MNRNQTDSRPVSPPSRKVVISLRAVTVAGLLQTSTEDEFVQPGETSSRSQSSDLHRTNSPSGIAVRFRAGSMILALAIDHERPNTFRRTFDRDLTPLRTNDVLFSGTACCRSCHGSRIPVRCPQSHARRLPRDRSSRAASSRSRPRPVLDQHLRSTRDPGPVNLRALDAGPRHLFRHLPYCCRSPSFHPHSLSSSPWLHPAGARADLWQHPDRALLDRSSHPHRRRPLPRHRARHLRHPDRGQTLQRPRRRRHRPSILVGISLPQARHRHRE